MMIKLPKQIILPLLPSVVLTLFSTSSIAVPNPANLIQSGYWSPYPDIIAVLNSRVGDSAYLAPALPFESRE